MATLYKNRNIWYITVSNGNNRLTRSLRTKDKQVAKQLMPSIELELLLQLSGAKQPSKNLSFDELIGHVKICNFHIFSIPKQFFSSSREIIPVVYFFVNKCRSDG